MYIQPNKQQPSMRVFYAAMALIAAVLVLLLVIVSPALFTKPERPNDTLTTTLPTSTDPPISDTALPLETEELPFDTGTATTPPATGEMSQTNDLPVIEVPSASATLAATEDAGQEYIDKIIFLGDSTTYSLLYYGVLSGGTATTQVWTPLSRTLTLDRALTTTVLYPDTNEEITIKEAVEAKKPEIMVITLGVNGISYMQEEYFISVYEKLIDMISEASPDTKIILQSIFPVAQNWEKQQSINNTKINTANKWIQAVAENTGVAYLDTISVLAIEEDGSLPISYQNGDGLHLNATSLAVVLEYIRTHALPGYASPASSAQ